MFKLGQKVKDKVTGFEGIIIAKVEYLNGCVQFAIRPKIKKGDSKFPENHYIDEGQLVLVSEGIRAKKKNNGGLMSDVPPGQYSI